MKQKLDDIVLNAGDNRLDIAMTPIVPVPLSPCVYCGATFTTEAELIAHMEAYHSEMPYLIYAYASPAEVAGGARYYIKYKAYIPTLREAPAGSNWRLVIYPERYLDLCLGANGGMIWLGTTGGQGFKEGSDRADAEYNPAPYKVYDIPRGTYALLSSLGAFTGPCEMVDQYWLHVDTGQTLTVV